jgi:type IV pilus assembly protein PilM
MSSSISRAAALAFAPPRFLDPPAAGIDISTSGVKLAVIQEHAHGLELPIADEHRFASGVFVGGEMTDRAAVTEGLKALAAKHRIRTAHVALPESRAYLFETQAEGATPDEWRASVERRIDEFVPLPPAEAMFGIVPFSDAPAPRVVGMGYARRAVEELLAVLDEAGVEAASLESETFSVPRALLKPHDEDTVLLIDIGRTTTKIVVATRRIPRFATTLDVGGHAFTLAVQKYFGVTEADAKRVKAEKGIAAADGNDEYLAAMLTTASVMREEIARRFDYWQGRAPREERIARAVLAGGNASIKGLPEYLAAKLGVPVAMGDVFANFASRDAWIPDLDYRASLAYATSIGLALRAYA